MVSIINSADEKIIEKITQNPFPQAYEHNGVHYPRTSSFTSFHPDSLNAKIANDEYTSRKLRIFYRRSIIGEHVHAAAAASVNNVSFPTIDTEDVRQKIVEYESQHIPDNEEIFHRFQSKDWRSESERIDSAVEAILIEVSQKVNLFLDWQAKVKPTLLLPADTGILSEELQYSGTPDLVVNILGKAMVIDIKCGSEVHEVNEVQLEAYRNILEAHYDIKIDCVKVLLLGSRRIKHKPLSEKNPHTYALCSINRRKKIVKELEHYVYLWHHYFSNPKNIAHCKFTGMPPSTLSEACPESAVAV